MPFNTEEFITQAFAWGIFLLLLQIIFLLLIRPIVLWYFRTNDCIEIQNKTLDELRRIRIEMQEQTRLQRVMEAKARGEINDYPKENEISIKADR